MRPFLFFPVFGQKNLVGLLLFAFLLPATLFSETIWQTSILGGLESARRENKPVIVELYADWCGYCKTLEKEIFPAPGVEILLRKYVAIRINGEQYPNFMERYNVTGFPTILFLDKNGVLVDKLAGLPTEGMVTGRLKSVLEKHDMEGQLLAKLKNSPGSVLENFNMGVYYYHAGIPEKSLVYFKNSVESKSADNPAKRHDAMYNLCLVYMDMEDFSESVSWWSRYIKQYNAQGDMFSAHYFRGLSLQKLGRKREARDDLRKARVLAPDQARISEIDKLLNSF